MSTKTPREKIHELIKQNYNENTARCVVALVMPVVDALLEEGKQETKKKIKKYIDENRVVLNSNDIFSVRCEKEATNSTLDDLEYFIKSL